MTSAFVAAATLLAAAMTRCECSSSAVVDSEERAANSRALAPSHAGLAFLPLAHLIDDVLHKKEAKLASPQLEAAGAFSKAEKLLPLGEPSFSLPIAPRTAPTHHTPRTVSK